MDIIEKMQSRIDKAFVCVVLAEDYLITITYDTAADILGWTITPSPKDLNTIDN